ncbi:nitrate- and nitrite sensing domain-containing protein [Streptomonospora halotolerans]|nr:nitrate- and nitrite sensing domain-containing protein [Streptomonospora nanhaiensis]
MPTRATDDAGGAVRGAPQPDSAVTAAEPRARWWAPREWRVRPRLIALIVIPTAAALVLGGLRISESIVNTVTHDRIEQMAALTESMVHLGDELGRERVYSAAYIADNVDPDERSQQKLDALQEQIQESRQAEQEVRNLIDGLGDPGTQLAANRLQGLQGSLGNLDTVRTEVQSTRTSVLSMVTKYRQVIGSLADFTQIIAEATSDTELRESVRALTALANAREELSYEGALMLHSLSTGTMSNGIRSEVEDSRAGFEHERENFRDSATTQQAQLYEEMYAGPEVSQVDTMRLRAVMRARDSQDITSVMQDSTPQDYQDALDGTLDRMHDLESTLASGVRTQADELRSGAFNLALLDTALVLAVLIAVFVLTSIVVRSLVRPLRALREGALRIAEEDLPGAIARMQESSSAPGDVEVSPIEVTSRDEIGEVARSFDEVHRVALRLASDEAALRSNVNAMFVNLSRRSQTLVERQLRLIDGLEQGEQDSDRLSDLFQLDHLATRMRRNNENLLVLSGQDNTRKWAQPVPLVDVLRGAISEVDEYERVNVRAPSHISVLGRPVNDVIHLVAELVENATAFSSKDTQVAVNAQVLEDGGVRVEVTDSGIGMPPDEIAATNARLAEPPVIDVGVSRRMGLFVVSRLAARHGIRVWLSEAHNGGITATAVLPPDLLITPVEPQAPVEPPALGPSAPDTYAEAAAAFAANPAPPEPGVWGGAGDFGRSSAASDLPKREPGYNRPAVSGASAPAEHPPSGEDLWAAGSSGWANPPAAPGARPLPPAEPRRTEPEPPRAEPPASERPPLPERPAPEPPRSPSPWDTPGWSGEPRRAEPEAPRSYERPAPPPAQPYAEERRPWEADSAPAAPSDNVWAAPSRRTPQPPRPEWSGDHDSREGYGSTAYISRRYGGTGAGQNTVVPPSPEESSSEALPIFDAIESNWFRRRSGGPASEPETGPLPRFADSGAADGARREPPAADSAGRYGSAPAAPAPAANGSSGGAAGSSGANGHASRNGAGARRPEDEWRSDADRGWQAARSAAEPIAGGLTSSGLPKRVPKANLVPGTAPAPEHVKQVPTRSADRVRNRFSGFQRGIREGRSQLGGQPGEDDK